jgi:ABC-type multidrug transport system ATPase subunit
MDEPASRLDARAPAVVWRAIRNIVDTRRTVVCTIHQPSIDILESFDEVNRAKLTIMLLSRIIN